MSNSKKTYLKKILNFLFLQFFLLDLTTTRRIYAASKTMLHTYQTKPRFISSKNENTEKYNYKYYKND